MSKDETIIEMAKVITDLEYAIAETFYNAGYRKVADDEIVVKRSELGKVVISHERADLVDMLNQETRELQRANAIKQETAREILRTFEEFDPYFYDYDIDVLINDIAQKYGID